MAMKYGDIAIIKTKDKQEFNGLILPSSNDKTISLKLDSGYNINIRKDNINVFRIVGSTKEKKEEEIQKPEFDKKLKTILILHTGGTLASRVSYRTGAVSPNYKPEEIVNMFPELKNIANIKSKLAGMMFSEDMRFAHYNIIAKEIYKEIKNVDGIIVTHGTDTLGLSSCALAFILENLDKPVILVGAQRSSDRPSSDSALNLICAARFIEKTDFNEVAVCMHGKSEDKECYILPACKTRKMHTSRRDAFRAINTEVIAKVDSNGSVEFTKEYRRKSHKEKLKLKLFKERIKIGILKAHPNMFASEVKNYNKFDGVVAEGSGIGGHFPINIVDKETKENGKIYSELKRLTKKIPVVASSNCIFGRINMNMYETGRKLQEAGIIGNLSDMTTETAFIKLAWLLSNYKKKDVRNLFLKSFRGEISDRTEYEEKFL